MQIYKNTPEKTPIFYIKMSRSVVSLPLTKYLCCGIICKEFDFCD